MSEFATAVESHGFVADGFEAVRDAFEENFTARGDVGAAVAVYRHGKPVVDLWGGDAGPGQPWVQDTVACGMSTVKPVMATAIAILVDRGLLDVDAPIAKIWPEFAANGKEDITAAHVLTQTSGLPSFPGQKEIVTFDDPSSFGHREQIAAALAAAPPIFEVGKVIASHSISLGWLLAEIIARASGTPAEEFIATEINETLGTDCWTGLPKSEQHRAAEMATDPAYDSDAIASFINSDSPAGRALCIGPKRRLGTALREATNDPEYRTFVNPSAGAFATARSLARVYAMLNGGGEIDGKRVIEADTVRRHTTIRIEGQDALFFVALRSSLGFLHASESIVYGLGENAFGFPGQGGQMAFTDPDSGISFCYIPRRIVFLEGQDPRCAALVEAVKVSL
jgi:CubicO group peptidase (beta-lactamase class C family)